MASSFGYEQGHYEVSQASGERVLFPAVRGSAADDLVVVLCFRPPSALFDALHTPAKRLATTRCYEVDHHEFYLWRATSWVYQQS
jgi:hypothetical protein